MKTTTRVEKVVRRKLGKHISMQKRKKSSADRQPAGRKATNASSCCVTGSRLNIDILQPAEEEEKNGLGEKNLSDEARPCARIHAE